MKNEQDNVLTRLRQAVQDLESQVNGTPEQARPAVWDLLDGVLGVGCAIRALDRVTGDVKNLTRQLEDHQKRPPSS